MRELGLKLWRISRMDPASSCGMAKLTDPGISVRRCCSRWSTTPLHSGMLVVHAFLRCANCGVRHRSVRRNRVVDGLAQDSERAHLPAPERPSGIERRLRAQGVEPFRDARLCKVRITCLQSNDHDVQTSALAPAQSLGCSVRLDSKMCMPIVGRKSWHCVLM